MLPIEVREDFGRRWRELGYDSESAALRELVLMLTYGADQKAAPRGFASFEVTDEHGNAWPPGHVSVLCNPKNPDGMCYRKHASSAQQSVAGQASVAAAVGGNGWAPLVLTEATKQARKAP